MQGGPSYPEHIDEELKSIKETMHLRWNPRCRVVVPGGIDAYGNPTEPKYEPRYELWDTDADGVDYRLMIVQNGSISAETKKEAGQLGAFRIPDRRLTEWLQRINPANYDGDIARVVEAMLLDPNSRLLDIDDRDFDDFIEGAAKWYWDYGKPKESVLADTALWTPAS